MKPDKNRARGIGFYLLIGVIILAVIFYLTTPAEQKEYTYSEIEELFRQEQVKSFCLEGDELTLNLYSPDSDGNTTIKKTLPSPTWFREDLGDLIEEQTASGVLTEYDYVKGWTAPWWMSILPYLISIVLFIGVWYLLMNKAGGGGAPGVGKFGKAHTRTGEENLKKVTFADVAGAEEEKEELSEIVDFLKRPQNYTAMGARIPKGVLLVGPPGTGKTLLARAVAGEAGVPFFSMSGSDFVEMFVGVGASRVRDLFDQAKKNSPCIIFIDEIDAVGRQRGAGLGGGHDEREQTLNQLLVEMDGFGANEGIIMIAATNRPDILDPALMRPGRFDRQVMVGYPDVKGREAILKVHARGKPLAPNVDLATIAKSTAGFTGADLENLLNEAALLAARKHLKAITMDEIEEATIKVVVGAEKKSHVMTDKEKTLTAYHEAGHAIAAYSCKTQDPVHQISIIPRGRAGGYTMQLPSEDRSYKSRSEMLESLVVLLGGRVAEALVLGDISTGASNDIERATQTVRAMITKYGMTDELGPITYGSDNSEPFLGRDMGHVRDYSEETASEIDAVLRKMISNAYHQTEQVLKEHMSKLHEVAKQLFLNEKMSGEEFYAIMEGPSPAEVPQEAGTTTENSVSENTEEKTEE